MTLVQTVGTLANDIVVVSFCISGIITIPLFFFFFLNGMFFNLDLQATEKPRHLHKDAM